LNTARRGDAGGQVSKANLIVFLRNFKASPVSTS
jgi:hypothetical protein